MAPGTCCVASWKAPWAAWTPGGSFPLSNFKRLFKQRHGVELSETALGHAKLSELLRDPRVSELCTVRLRTHGYAVCPSQRPAAPTALRSLLRSLLRWADRVRPTELCLPLR